MGLLPRFTELFFSPVTVALLATTLLQLISNYRKRINYTYKEEGSCFWRIFWKELCPISCWKFCFVFTFRSQYPRTHKIGLFYKQTKLPKKKKRALCSCQLNWNLQMAPLMGVAWLCSICNAFICFSLSSKTTFLFLLKLNLNFAFLTRRFSTQSFAELFRYFQLFLYRVYSQ